MIHHLGSFRHLSPMLVHTIFSVVLLFLFSSSFFELLLNVFVSKLPKGIAASKSGDGDELMNPMCQWRCLMAQTLSDIFRTVTKDTSFIPSSFCDRFRPLLVSYILSLYSALGLGTAVNLAEVNPILICGAYLSLFNCHDFVIVTFFYFA